MVTFLVVAYLLIGVVVYAIADTSRMASRISRAAFVVSYGAVQKYLFLFVVALWPVWLLITARTSE